MIIANLSTDVALTVQVFYQNGKTAETKNLLPGQKWQNDSASVVKTITALMVPNTEATPYVFQKIPYENFKIVFQNNGFAVLSQ